VINSKNTYESGVQIQVYVISDNIVPPATSRLSACTCNGFGVGRFKNAPLDVAALLVER